MSRSGQQPAADRLLTAEQFATLPREDAGFWGAPDLAVEYLDAGVRLVWVIDPPTRTATTYGPDGTARILRSTDTLDGGDVLPGFLLSLAGFFAV